MQRKAVCRNLHTEDSEEKAISVKIKENKKASCLVVRNSKTPSQQ